VRSITDPDTDHLHWQECCAVLLRSAARCAEAELGRLRRDTRQGIARVLAGVEEAIDIGAWTRVPAQLATPVGSRGDHDPAGADETLGTSAVRLLELKPASEQIERVALHIKQQTERTMPSLCRQKTKGFQQMLTLTN
jgi:hypothetical protein